MMGRGCRARPEYSKQRVLLPPPRTSQDIEPPASEIVAAMRIIEALPTSWRVPRGTEWSITPERVEAAWDASLMKLSEASLRGVLSNTPEGTVIVLVVDDSEDDTLTHLVASENAVPSPRFGGIWGTGQQDNHWLLAFQLIELGAGPDGVNRQWYTAYFDETYLAAILAGPHLVAVLPAELAGEARTLDMLLPRLQAALYVRVEHVSPEVQQILDERRGRG